MAALEKPDAVEHLDYEKESQLHGFGSSGGRGASVDSDVVDADFDVLDEKANKKLNRRLDARIIPLCCWVYLLNFLDRGELGLGSVPPMVHCRAGRWEY